MGRIIAGMASSHAFALSDPDDWDRIRERNREGFKRRYGKVPPVHPKLTVESLEDRRRRYNRVKAGLSFLREKLRDEKPDAMILVGDDQNENFKEDNLPQISLYVGDYFLTTEQGETGRQPGPAYRCHSGLAHSLLNGLVEREFDVAFSTSFPNSELLSHAHGPILRRILPEADIPVVLLFVNAVHVPAISPQRCYRLGQAIRTIVEGRDVDERVAIYASGGLSHFTAGYPWSYYKGPFTYGSISEEFDRTVLELMARGNGDQLTRFTSQDLLENGEIELRSWIVLLGSVGELPAQVLAYEPFYSGLMGMGVAYWDQG